MMNVIGRIREAIVSMSIRRRVVLVVVLVVVGLLIGIIFAASQRLFPALVVNGTLVSARRVDRNLRAAVVGYERIRAAYGLDTTTTTAIGRDEMERQVLDQLIDAVLIDQAARREVGSELPTLIAAKTERYREDEKLSLAAEQLYNLSFATFVDEVLIPQAERDILSGRLFLRGEKFSEWLSDARREASVTIFSGRFRWEDGRLVVVAP